MWTSFTNTTSCWVICLRIKGECFAYESESLEKVMKAFGILFDKPSIQTVRGAFGTRIRILRAEVTGKKAKELYAKILDALDEFERQSVENARRAKRKVYLEFDKQAAYQGKLKEGKGLVVEIYW